MHILIGDIGNTVTKICLVDIKNFSIKKIFYFNSKEIKSQKYLISKLKKILKNKSICKTALFSSVVPNYQLSIKRILNKTYKIKMREIKEKSLKKGVKINIKNSKQVGSDRIANAVGAFKRYKSDCIILDFGTATTFDVITKYGVYNGGIIAPGVNLSMQSLSNSADQIPFFSIKKQKKVIGKNTIEALRSGFYWGYSGLINNIILKIENETKKKYKIIFTGGYAHLFKTSMIRPFVIDKNITIDGIIEIYKNNKSNLIK
ncbi:MAG TPA: type III pantothenate kinase [Candidatus Pelagibacter sp.]|jgi:type III pantothenate kinase|nr:type III pantothenate kinase [Candidatus Pelagibacter sp.]